jgi:hypothetical protein
VRAGPVEFFSLTDARASGAKAIAAPRPATQPKPRACRRGSRCSSRRRGRSTSSTPPPPPLALCTKPHALVVRYGFLDVPSLRNVLWRRGHGGRAEVVRRNAGADDVKTWTSLIMGAMDSRVPQARWTESKWAGCSLTTRMGRMPPLLHQMDRLPDGNTQPCFH